MKDELAHLQTKAINSANNSTKRNKQVMQAAIGAAIEEEVAAAIVAAVPDASDAEIATAIRVRKIVLHDLVWPTWFYDGGDPRRLDG